MPVKPQLLRNVLSRVYGEMFPAEELPRLAEPSPDIVGRTDVDSIFAALADWVDPGSSSTVFPGIKDARIEQGVNLGVLLAG